MTKETLNLAMQLRETASGYWTENEIPIIEKLIELLAQPEQPEPVAHLWECIGRWSAYLVNNGKQADCAPPSWLIDAVNNATTPPKRTWVDLTPQDLNDIFKISHTGEGALKIIKEKNA